MRTMYDAITWSNIPPLQPTDLVAGYVDGKYAWNEADWLRFPTNRTVRIAVFASTDDGHVLDVEAGNSGAVASVNWTRMRRGSGLAFPTVYCSRLANGYSWWEVIQAHLNAGVYPPNIWLSTLDNDQTIYNGTIGNQYVDTGPYDISTVVDYWPGVDVADTSIGDARKYAQDAKNAIADAINTLEQRALESLNF